MERRGGCRAKACARVAFVGAALVLTACRGSDQPGPSQSENAASLTFRYQLTYTLAAEVNARMAMVGEYIGGADPAQFAGEATWATLEQDAQQACATAATEGWGSARAELEDTLQTGVTSGDPGDSSIFVTALVNAATAQDSFCPELSSDR